jgi:import inner membrane translocase subunit TIM16
VCFRMIPAKHILRFLRIDAKHRPQGAIGSDVAGVGNATTGSMTDKLTREHRMTLDEAHLILDTKPADGMERILQVCPSEFG